MATREEDILADSIREFSQKKRAAYMKAYQSTPEYKIRQKSWRAKSEVRRKELFLWIKQRAMRAGVPYELQAGDLVVPERCPVLGIVLERGSRDFHESAPSVDRIIPSKGYVKGNVAVISNRANILKRDCTDPNELYAVSCYVASHMSLDQLVSAARNF